MLAEPRPLHSSMIGWLWGLGHASDHTGTTFREEVRVVLRLTRGPPQPIGGAQKSRGGLPVISELKLNRQGTKQLSELFIKTH